MALKGLDIFKLSPKTNCKECGCPTCMAFSMKVAQGAVSIDKCPYMAQDAIDKLSEQTAPPMKTIKVGEGSSAQTFSTKVSECSPRGSVSPVFTFTKFQSW